MTRIIPFLLFALAACETPGARPRDMTAEDNRAAAAEHRERADEEAKAFDPKATSISAVTTRDGDVIVEEVNPTQRFRDAADRDLREAKAHEREAAKLDKLDDAACSTIPPGARAACPILGTIASLQKVAGGAKIKLVDKTQTDAVAARIRCHAAYARSRQGEGLDMCPLYVEGLRVDVDGDWITLRSFAPNHADERLLKLLREHLPAAKEAGASE